MLFSFIQLMTYEIPKKTKKTSYTYFATQTNFNNNQNISRRPYRFPTEFYTYLLYFPKMFIAVYNIASLSKDLPRTLRTHKMLIRCPQKKKKKQGHQ